MRDTDDFVEGIGIERAKERANQADLRVFLIEEDQQPEIPVLSNDIVLQAKADENRNGVGISGKTGQGVPELIAAITARLSELAGRSGIATRERHRIAMVRSRSGLAEAQNVLAFGPDHYDIAAEEIRSAIRALDSLVGRVDVENLLDEIFSSFCVGK